MKMNKKAQYQIGIAIIVMAILLLLGGIFLNPNSSTSTNSNSNSKSNSNSNNSYFFDLSSTGIGKQMLQIQNYPNIILGSKEESNIIFRGNNFRLNANPFTTIGYSFEINLNKEKNINYYLLYFNYKKISGNQDLIMFANGKIISKNKLENMNFPIRFYNTFNTSKIFFTFLIDKPSWYSFFNWNKFDINELKIVEVRQDKQNNLRNFDFQINKDFLERVNLDLVISCDKIAKISEAIEVNINGFIVSNANPKCTSKNNKLTIDVPINILSNKANRLTFKTNGFYKLAFSLNKIYYNDQQTYRFDVTNFNDFNDVVMSGDFDKDIIDVKINNQQFSLVRNQYLSIISYLRLGVNEITFLNKPLEIKKFSIEKVFYN